MNGFTICEGKVIYYCLELNGCQLVLRMLDDFLDTLHNS